MKSVQVAVFLLLCVSLGIPAPVEQEVEELSSRLESFRRNATLSTSSSSLLLVGGQEATPHQFPYTVAIAVRNYEGGYDHWCGGVIYDSTYIITAAHCVRGIHPNNFKVIAGEHEIFAEEGAEQYRDVQKYFYHPNYDPQNYDNDIAIITLVWPLDLNENIRPLHVPLKKRDNPPTGRTVGWGSDGVDDQTSKLFYVDLNFYPRDVCREAYQFVGEITEGMVCAGDANGGKGTCRGDSGGPLVCRDEENGEYLCGLVSWGMVFCATKEFPSVFTDIYNYGDWLQDNLPPVI